MGEIGFVQHASQDQAPYLTQVIRLLSISGEPTIANFVNAALLGKSLDAVEVQQFSPSEPLVIGTTHSPAAFAMWAELLKVTKGPPPLHYGNDLSNYFRFAKVDGYVATQPELKRLLPSLTAMLKDTRQKMCAAQLLEFGVPIDDPAANWHLLHGFLSPGVIHPLFEILPLSFRDIG